VTSRIVAIDTTSESGSFALIESGRMLDEVSVSSAEGFGHVLFPQLERLLSRHGWSPADVDCYAAAAGPGSFTGVRVGLAAIKGLGEALGKPVVVVSNLQALAWHGTAPLRAVFLDARRGEVYAAVYSASLELVSPESPWQGGGAPLEQMACCLATSNAVHHVLPERVLSFSAWIEALPEAGLEFLSTDFSAFAAVLAETRFRDAPRRTVPRALAGAIGRIAADRLAGGLATIPAAADANYVRRSDAELLWKEP
jgi:tRNA threonylcarbamoyladenosine biosynthesis protein TsaB